MGSTRKLQDAPFAIYCDEPNSLHSPDSSYGSTFDDAARKHNDDTRADSPIQSVEVDITPAGYGSTTEYDNDNDNSSSDYPSALRRNITATSVSSLPPSALPSENEGQFTPTKGPRPSYLSPGLRRVPIGASSSDRLSPHKSFRPSSAKKSANVRSSPRPRTRERQDEVETQFYPLVLLHVTILPITLPWSQATIRRALPRSGRDNLALLKSRLSELVLQRGVLIQHPQEDFQLLEERVVEALGLDVSNGAFCDSGDEYGGFQDYDVSENDDSCQTCGDPNCFNRRVPKSWEVRVYAANGLMRAGAWAAAWSEMERVDFEIVPHIPRDVRRRLDEVQAEEDGGMREEARYAPGTQEERTAPREEPTPTTRQKAPEPDEVLLSPAKVTKDPIEVLIPLAKIAVEPPVLPTAVPLSSNSTTETIRRPSSKNKPASSPKSDTSLPAAYRPKEIPLRILLGNYLYVLAQDRRNVAILFLLATIIFSTVHGLRAANGSSLAGMYDGYGEVDMLDTLSIDAGGVDIGDSAWEFADSGVYAASELELTVEAYEPLLITQPEIPTDGMEKTEEHVTYEPNLVKEEAVQVQPPRQIDEKELFEIKEEDFENEEKNDEHDRKEAMQNDVQQTTEKDNEENSNEENNNEENRKGENRNEENKNEENNNEGESNEEESNENNDSVEAEQQTANDDSCPAGNMFTLAISAARYTK